MSYLIDKEKARKMFLNEGQKLRRFKLGEKWQMNYPEICNVLNKIPAENRWIPLSEGLPQASKNYKFDTSENVLLTVKDSDGDNETITGFFGYYPNRADKSLRGWWAVWDGGCKKLEKEVIAWMPLPEPYREGE